MSEPRDIPENQVLWLNEKLEPVPKEQAVLGKVWIDGEPVFFFVEPEERP